VNSLAISYVNSAKDRLEIEQMKLLLSMLRFSIKPIFYVDLQEDLHGRPKLGDILGYARNHTSTNYIAWCNSDCVLVKNPFEVLNSDPTICHGFYRTELPSNTVTYGVDMYIIPNEIWDNHLSKDIPDMYVGGSHIDWWVSHACQKIRKYKTSTGFLSHVSHEKTAAATDASNPIYQHNLASYNSWAERNEINLEDKATYFL
jgi:hypothetical protein